MPLLVVLANISLCLFLCAFVYHYIACLLFIVRDALIHCRAYPIACNNKNNDCSSFASEISLTKLSQYFGWTPSTNLCAFIWIFRLFFCALYEWSTLNNECVDVQYIGFWICLISIFKWFDFTVDFHCP